MNNKNTNRKGFTLVELVIVLAVVVIAAGMVVTFSTMMHGAQGVSNARYEALQDVKVAESLIESFIENNAGKVKIQDGGAGQRGDVLYVGESFEKKTSFVFLSRDGEGSALIYVASTQDDNKTKPLISLQSINSVEFETVEFTKNGTTDTLYYCTITYDVADTPFTYTFCVNPYEGEGGN